MSRLFSEEISGSPDFPGKDEGRGRLPFLKEPGKTWLWQPSYCLPQGCEESGGSVFLLKGKRISEKYTAAPADSARQEDNGEELCA